MEFRYVEIAMSFICTDKVHRSEDLSEDQIKFAIMGLFCVEMKMELRKCVAIKY